MKIRRRGLLRLAAGAIATPAVSRLARAETDPSWPVHLIIGYRLADRPTLPRGCLANGCRSGSTNNLLLKAGPVVAPTSRRKPVARPPDGYTLFLASPANATNPAPFAKLPFDFIH